MSTTVIATGSFVPERRESNEALEEELRLTAGWIKRRTGVCFRAIADPADAVTDLATRACDIALQRVSEFGIERDAISTLILATSTPDHLLPPSAPKVAFDLGLRHAGAFDVTVACCGFLHAMILADALVQTQGKPVLVAAANILSRRCRKDDTGTRPMFADAAGAVVLAPHDDTKERLSMFGNWDSDGSGWNALMIPDGGSRSPINEDTFEQARHLMQMDDGMAVFRYAAGAMAKRGLGVLRTAGLTIKDIDWWIPHQANLRIIETAGRGMKVDPAKTLTTLADFGNSSAATIPVTLDHFMHSAGEKRISSGDRILMTAAAAGMTSAGVLLELP